MTNDQLDKGLHIAAEIRELKHFVSVCHSCWKIIRIQRLKKYRLETSYGFLAGSIRLSPELADRIVETIEEYIADKEKELESL